MPDETPPAENPAPVVVTPEIVILEFPVFVSVTFCELLAPTLMLGNVTLDGLAVSVNVAATPVPDSGIESGEFGALLEMEMEPLAEPAVVGSKATLNVRFCPALMVTEGVSPVMLKPAPVTVAAEIVSVELPPFVSVTGVVFVLPVVTFPKLTEAGLGEICG